MKTFDEDLLDTIAASLVAPGYIILEQVFPDSMLNLLLAHFSQSEFRPAGIGRQANFQLQEAVRSDQIHWLASENNFSTCPEQDAVSHFLHWMDTMRTGINRRLYLGLNDYESHFARYSVGAFYRQHRDAFSGQTRSGQANRVVSTVLYLNPAWHPDYGGELMLYADDGVEVLEKIAPEFGRLVIFLSEKFPHEVLPANQERKSIAGWFRAGG